ncbi:FAD-dependent pyridine nucleotide-disulfide oxidoreductase [Caldicellulosiruptor saccharolyticus DSM 8903]|uniref:FAD-dependent pyridine nucleotide-disulfide oxidoreductase n=1 Tax=Caldicellulosiruptor saccharolyticus (strain ATCC 43494 / DSM 8903 / Tp8T 6331) TaxID=351627 RepID=A4XGK6_CALS8|nr:FAD-dependent oxidoreductase [Caldicellulosiruptor saccharolyticus]ABP66041.1 FAD-dependent pyridine nucleotide-disulfide oxidoreductase [Caldicellulosiruptor saccharolyticus DSM 8903]
MKYLIIGASAAGLSCAKTLRRLDNNGEIVVISKDDMVYSRCMLHYFISDDRPLDKMRFVEEDFFDKNKIKWIRNTTVMEIRPFNKSVVTSDGAEHTYDKLLIATGATPVIPSIEGLAEGIEKRKDIFTLRDIGDAIKIKKAAKTSRQAVVIGGGLIGLDVAVSLNKQGVKVTVIEVKDHILPQQLDKTAAQRYERMFKDNGIDIITGQSVSNVIYGLSGKVKGVTLSDGSFVFADMIVVAVGVKPSFPRIDKCHLKIENGIIVDQYQRTSIQDIYAAGDVCQSYELLTQRHILTPIWPSAVKQGQTAAYNMAGIDRHLIDNFGFKNSMKFFGLSTISYGYVEPPDDSYNVAICSGPNYYYKVVYKENVLYGAIIQGDISGAGVIGKLIQDKYNLSNKLVRNDWNNVFRLTYGDFFKQNQDGTFEFAC